MPVNQVGLDPDRWDKTKTQQCCLLGLAKLSVMTKISLFLGRGKLSGTLPCLQTPVALPA